MNRKKSSLIKKNIQFEEVCRDNSSPRFSHATSKILQPFNLESKANYFDRFVANKEMKELFPNATYRSKLANKIFCARWLSAQVTVTKLDGTQFFID